MQKRKFSLNLHRIVGLVLALLLVLLIGLPVYAQEPLAGFDEYVEKAMGDWEVPGLAIAIVKEGEIVLAKGYGLREIGKDEPVDEHTVFGVGSATKAFTAASVALLVDEGRLNWDDPAIKHLPDFQLYDPWVTRELTVRDLLSHRSGLPDHGADAFQLLGYDRDEILRRIRYLEPASSFRSKYAYQNMMYIAAGQVVAAVSSQSWDDFVMERIFTPLGMTASSTSIEALPDVENVATPHARIDGQVQVIPWRNYDNSAPCGSINSNVVDMAQWIRLQLAGGMYGDQQLLSPASVKQMHASQTIIHPGDDPMADFLGQGASFINYGLGWFLHDYAGRKVVQHGGEVDGMSALVAMIPQENLGLVILTNMNGTVLPYALMFRVFDAFLGLPERDWSADILEVVNTFMEQAAAAQKQIMEARVEGTTPSLPLQEYAGTYVDEMYGEARVTVEDGKLVVEFGPAALTGDLLHWHYDIFLLTVRGLLFPGFPATFTLDAMGKVDSMEVQGYPRFEGSFKRVPEVEP